MLPNLLDNVEDKGKVGWTKGLDDETRDRGKPLQPMKNGYKGRNGLIPVNKKSDTNYRLFCGDAPQNPTLGRWGDPMAVSLTGQPTSPYCCAAVKYANALCRVEGAKQLSKCTYVQQDQKRHGGENKLFQRLHHTERVD